MLAEPVSEPIFEPQAAPLPTQTERNWAMLAHLSALLTAFVAASTGGVGYVIALLVPLALYLYFAGRSRYVAFHALQATGFQALAGVMYVVVAGVLGAAIAAAWVVAGVLSIVLVGLLLMPLALGLSLMVGFQLLVLPVVGLFYAVYGAYYTYEGRDFEYPWVGRVVARSLQS
jgi:uncharacterized Tic20 family protein